LRIKARFATIPVSVGHLHGAVTSALQVRKIFLLQLVLLVGDGPQKQPLADKGMDNLFGCLASRNRGKEKHRKDNRQNSSKC